MGPDVGSCKAGEKYEGLWEVPLYQMQKGTEMMGVGSEYYTCCTAALFGCLLGAGWEVQSHWAVSLIRTEVLQCALLQRVLRVQGVGQLLCRGACCCMQLRAAPGLPPLQQALDPICQLMPGPRLPSQHHLNPRLRLG